MSRGFKAVIDRTGAILLGSSGVCDAHADFDEQLSSVEECRPKFVITDRYRVGGAVALARELMRRQGIPASPLP